MRVDGADLREIGFCCGADGDHIVSFLSLCYVLV